MGKVSSVVKLNRAIIRYGAAATLGAGAGAAVGTMQNGLPADRSRQASKAATTALVAGVVTTTGVLQRNRVMAGVKAGVKAAAKAKGAALGARLLFRRIGGRIVPIRG